ncbi:LMBRD2 [Bugula neritina]|uniref:LMBRD2 n=1 Tax=Bugula neritina TaxID=10212 RepID=A0A7J7IZ17_BUGNE|nr:LMBRD2 [Bugula neritina]
MWATHSVWDIILDSMLLHCIISILVLAYLCVCAYRTVFKIRVFNYYYVASNHQTDENSLLFSGMLLSRLTPPLCLNFLSLIQLDSHVTKDNRVLETEYTKIMGHMDVISFIANGFNVYFPIAIVLLCCATIFKLGSRLLHCIGFEQFIDDDISQEIVDEGKSYVQREKIKSARSRDQLQRRTALQNSIRRSELGNKSSASITDWNNYKSCDSTSNNVEARRYSSKSRRGQDSDRIELLSDQDVVDYDPTNVHDGYLRGKQDRSKPSSGGFFDDI